MIHVLSLKEGSAISLQMWLQPNYGYKTQMPNRWKEDMVRNAHIHTQTHAHPHNHPEFGLRLDKLNSIIHVSGAAVL